MGSRKKCDLILDALQTLLEEKNLQYISVNEIAQKAGIGKSSIYYYFTSKDAILDALVERNYKKALETAKTLAKRTEISPFTRMAMLLQACRNTSMSFVKQESADGTDGVPVERIYEKAYVHQKYLKHVITELKGPLTEIIQQGIEKGDINFKYPAELAEITLIVLSVKLDNTLSPAEPKEIEEIIRALIALLEKGTENPPGSLDFLRMI